MNDLTDRLANLWVAPDAATDPQTVAQDLERGRQRLRLRRRHRWAAGFTLACVVAGGGLVVDHQASSDHGAHDAAQVRLVAYTGPQQVGFVVTEIPEGYVLQGSNRANLDIALPGDQTDLSVFADKIVVALLSSDSTPDVKDGLHVSINGHQGAIRESDDGVRVLEYNDGTHEVQLQIWSDIKLTDAQLVTFAESVTVTSEAIVPRG
jgi:hypothetical protein